jgi:hypothetical protein
VHFRLFPFSIRIMSAGLSVPTSCSFKFLQLPAKRRACVTDTSFA